MKRALWRWAGLFSVVFWFSLLLHLGSRRILSLRQCIQLSIAWLLAWLLLFSEPSQFYADIFLDGC